jgi:hypothetical protein
MRKGLSSLSLFAFWISSPCGGGSTGFHLFGCRLRYEVRFAALWLAALKCEPFRASSLRNGSFIVFRRGGRRILHNDVMIPTIETSPSVSLAARYLCDKDLRSRV